MQKAGQISTGIEIRVTAAEMTFLTDKLRRNNEINIKSGNPFKLNSFTEGLKIVQPKWHGHLNSMINGKIVYNV